MMRQVGTALGGSSPTSASAGRHPVRRGSRLAGSCEGVFWRRTDRQAVRRVVLAAKRYELAGRQGGHRNGPLGHVALEALELLANLVSYRSGRLEPAITYLMGRLRRSKDAVVRALSALRAHGFLDWLRRHEAIPLVEGPGPRVRQVSNAYRLALPPRAARLLGHLLSDVPLPDDVVEAREDRAAWLAARKAGLPLSELPLVEIEDDRLARALGALARIDRDSLQPLLWAPASVVPPSVGRQGAWPHFGDRAKPGVICVGPDGRRFANEAMLYHDFVPALISEYGAHPEGPHAWLLAGHASLRRYGLGPIGPFPVRLAPNLRAGYHHAARQPREPAATEAA